MKSIVYFLQRENGDIKIGTTTNYPIRYLALCKQHGDLKLLGVRTGSIALENELHKQFAQYRVKGEFYSAAEKLLDYIRIYTSLNAPTERVDRGTRMATKERTTLAVYMIAEKLQANSITKVSADTVIWDAIIRLYPDVARKALAALAEGKTEDTEGDDEGSDD